ncbi:TetR/AcrR family transcriptional regulator [Stenotrophomonas sp. Betaine-02u-21]|nr:TetR/AcrR family transcriptional regulator [Stenotrophomonas sp. Betaine-02u-23]PKH75821.1 TetR/AcrR family transcriptional regulator [Stenotrophomonas sp. Betaine-02u-21]PKH95593.1 TetR/AcrR family transcriptional regulator [Stenotrophomonas sp. Bg11-02]
MIYMDHISGGADLKQGTGTRRREPAADARIVKTRRALAQAVLALSEEKDFDALTIAEITARAGVGYATFFRHYPDKETLLAEVAEPLLDELLAKLLPGLLQQDTRAAALSLFQFAAGRRAIFLALLSGSAAATVRRRLIERAAAREWPEDLRRSSEVPRDLVITHAVTSTLGLLSAWLAMDDRLPASAMGALLDRLVFAPIRGLG